MRVLLVISLMAATTVVDAADSPSKYALFVAVAKYKHADLNVTLPSMTQKQSGRQPP